MKDIDNYSENELERNNDINEKNLINLNDDLSINRTIYNQNSDL